MLVPSSKDRNLEYRPCAVTLRDGRYLPCVYVVPTKPYMGIWGVPPEADPGKRSIDIREVAEISECATRLPPEFATYIYEGGESGMGYCLFTLVFKDGTRQSYGTGGAVDFVRFPEGYSAADIKEVERHAGRYDTNRMEGEEYCWCLYDGIESSE